MNIKLASSIDSLIYDPVKGRVLYDLLISGFSNLLILLLFAGFGKEQINNFIIPISYTLLQLSFNSVFGLYGKNKTSNLRIKLQIILISNILTFILLAYKFNDHFLLSTFLSITIITTTLPRFFLNFNVDRITFSNTTSGKKGPILIVGGGGYIGSVLVEKLLQKGERVRVLDKFIYSKEVFKGMRNLKKLEIMEGDISDIYALTMAVKDSSAIVHLAGIVGDPAAKIDEKLTRHVNIASTRLLKETAKAFGVRSFIFASSCSVYGSTTKVADEKTMPKPVSLYAKTKVDSEKELISDRADNFHPTVLRFATVFGHSRKPRFDLVTNLFVAEAFKKNIIKVNGGNQWRPLIHVRDVAEAIIKVLNAEEKIVSREIFNVGDNRMNYRILELAENVKKIINNPKVEIKSFDNKKDNRNYKVSFNKIKNTLGFENSITLQKGINEIYKNFISKKYKDNYLDPFYINIEITKELKKEFRSKRYKKSHFSTIS